MKAITAYLNFDGTTRDAMTFYAKALGATLHLQSFKDAKLEAPEGAENRIIHARLEKGSAALMASDTMPGTPFRQGNNVFVCVDCETIPETERLFTALGEGGTVMMPLQDTFWGARFGMLTDKFGVQWMFNCDQKKG
jgi:PhnB protein